MWSAAIGIVGITYGIGISWQGLTLKAAAAVAIASLPFIFGAFSVLGSPQPLVNAARIEGIPVNRRAIAGSPDTMSFEPHEIAWTPEKSKRIWDYYGSRPQFRSAFFGYIAGPMVARKFMTAVAPAADARILDFSCGQGDVIAALMPHLKGNQEIHACDFSDTYVDAVAKRFQRCAPISSQPPS